MFVFFKKNSSQENLIWKAENFVEASSGGAHSSLYISCFPDVGFGLQMNIRL